MQRIINSSVNRRTKASPATILFGNKLDLNRGILTPHLLPDNVLSGSCYITDLIDMQDKVLDAAIQSIEIADGKQKQKDRFS